MTTGQEVRTFVFFDLETTGLAPSSPRITELSMIAVHRTELALPRQPPRVLNKLTLCFNPQKPIGQIATRVSGLDSNNLFYQKDFDKNARISIESFLQRLDPPVCLLAHNGNKFDFGLLRVELQLHQRQSCQGILCADTLLAFKATDENGTPHQQLFPNGGVSNGYSLEDIYKREFGRSPEQSHQAEGDCMALLKVVMSRANKMLPWFDANAVPLGNIPLMYQLPPDRSPLPIDQFPYQLDETVHLLD